MYSEVLTRFYLENFKTFKEPQVLEIAPITLIFGPNSAGKSSIIQAILLARHLIESRKFNVTQFLQDGNVIDLGGYNQFVHGQNKNRTVGLGWNNFKVNFNADEIKAFNWYGDDGKLFFQGSFQEKRLKRCTIDWGNLYGAPLKEAVFVALGQQAKLSKKAKIPAGKIINEELLKKAIHSVFESAEWQDRFIPTPREFPTPAWLQWRLEDALSEKRQTSTLAKEMLLRSAMNVVNGIDGVWWRDASLHAAILSEVSYFGPLRPILQRNSILAENSENQTWTFSKEAQEEVNRWLKDPMLFKTPLRLETLQIHSKDSDFKQKSVHLIDVKRKIKVGFSDIGAGYSQVLPFLLKCFSEPHWHRAIILAEQPELHLHPALQAELGDVIIRAVEESGFSRIICETHSEHILLRIMRRIRETAEGRDTPFPITNKDVSILFVESVGTHSMVRQMPLDNYGRLIRDWPGGFFEEGLREVLL